MKSMLLVVDMQNGFMPAKCQHIVPVVSGLIEHFNAQNKPVVFTRFINIPESGYVKWIRWSRLMTEPEINIIPELQQYVQKTFDKNYYTAFTDEFSSYIKENEIERVYICGVATDSCVLKSAIDAFEKGIEPLVIKDACYSHAGDEAHNAGLYLLSRNIGKYQIIESQQVLSNNEL